jgi:hypothetical protein
MPVIRVDMPAPLLNSKERHDAVEQLKSELEGRPTQDGPVIFEIPFEQQPRFDVVVVWERWSKFPSADRSEMIAEAYAAIDPNRPIAQALGLTYEEAMEQLIIPYAVIPMSRPGDIDPEILKAAMLKEGAFRLPNGKIDLRFPTMALAEQAHKRLVDDLPKGYWSIVQTVQYLK